MGNEANSLGILIADAGVRLWCIRKSLCTRHKSRNGFCEL